eukprot:366442-Chlamydomonas_euryale.AAC.15
MYVTACIIWLEQVCLHVHATALLSMLCGKETCLFACGRRTSVRADALSKQQTHLGGRGLVGRELHVCLHTPGLVGRAAHVCTRTRAGEPDAVVWQPMRWTQHPGRQWLYVLCEWQTAGRDEG